MVTVDSVELAQAVRRLKLVLRRKAQKRADARLYVVGGRLVIETDEGRMAVLASGEFGTSVRIQAVHLVRIGAQDRGSRPVTFGFDGEWLEVSDGRSKFRCAACVADGLPPRREELGSAQQTLPIPATPEPSPNVVLPFEPDAVRAPGSGVPGTASTQPRVATDPLDPVVERAIELLHDVISSRRCSVAAIVSVAKALHRLRRVPEAVDVGAITVTVTGPRRWHGEVETYFWWDVSVEGTSVALSSGGHFYRRSTGGDSFRSYTWQWSPGEPALVRDYRDRLAVVPALESFATGIPDVSSGEYSIAVEDGDNELLADRHEEFNEIDEPPDASTVAGGTGGSMAGADNEPGLGAYATVVRLPIDEQERELILSLDARELDAHEPEEGYDFDADACAKCGIDLSSKSLAIDGRLRDEAMWGMFCAACYQRVGAGLGTGHGQLYARQRAEVWTLIAGFPAA